MARTNVTVPISMTPEELEWVEARVARLGVEVANRSHYVRKLIAMDRRDSLLAETGLVKAQPTGKRARGRR